MTSRRSLSQALACALALSAVVTAPAGAAPKCSVRGAVTPRSGGWTTVRDPAYPRTDTMLTAPAGGPSSLGLAVAPYDERIVYAHNGHTVMRTTDRGCHWQQVLAVPSLQKPALVIDPDGIDPDMTVVQMLTPPSRLAPRRLYVLFQGNWPRLTLARSDDAGATWSFHRLGVNNVQARIVVAPSAPDVLYARVANGAAGPSYVVSRNGGADWTVQLPDPVPTDGGDDDPATAGPGPFWVDPYDADVLYESSVTTKGGAASVGGDYFRISRDGGASWSTVTAPFPSMSKATTTVWPVGVNGRTRLYGGYATWAYDGTPDRFFVSDDGGYTLAGISTQPCMGPFAMHPYESGIPTAVQASNPDSVVVGSGGSLWLLSTASARKGRRACTKLGPSYVGHGYFWDGVRYNEPAHLSLEASTLTARRTFYVMNTPDRTYTNNQPGRIEIYSGKA